METSLHFSDRLNTQWAGTLTMYVHVTVRRLLKEADTKQPQQPLRIQKAHRSEEGRGRGLIVKSLTLFVMKTGLLWPRIIQIIHK